MYEENLNAYCYLTSLFLILSCFLLLVGIYFAFMVAMADKITDSNLRKVIRLCNEMLELADQGDECRTDAGCGVVYGTLRDLAYKLRRLAKNELAHHSIACRDEL